MNENVWPMLIAMTVAIFNFFVAGMMLKSEDRIALFLLCANLVFGIMNTATAIKYLLK